MTGDRERQAIYADAGFYDWLARFTAPGDLPFYRRLRRAHPGPLLELGCGTGRVCLALAAEGAEVSGIDRSTALLERARARARDLAPPPRLLRADIRGFDLRRTFDLLLLPYNTLNHLIDGPDLADALGCIRRHMHAESRLVIDTFNPDLDALHADGSREQRLLEFPRQHDGVPISLLETAAYDRVAQVYDSRWRFCEPDGRLWFSDRIRIRVYFPQEIDQLLWLQGLRIEAKYGDYDGRLFGADSPKQLLVCRLAPAG